MQGSVFAVLSFTGFLLCSFRSSLPSGSWVIFWRFRSDCDGAVTSFICGFFVAIIGVARP